jgi:hypothetical protein
MRVCADIYPRGSESDMRADIYPRGSETYMRADIHPQGSETLWTATGHERPVFLDEHGKRRRWVWLGGALTGGASAFWLGALIAGAIGFSTMPSIRERSSLLASRVSPHPVAAVAPRRRRAVSHARHSPSSLGGATELAVSRALIAAR